METKRGNSLAFHLFSTHQTVLLLIITGALAKVYCGDKPWTIHAADEHNDRGQRQTPSPPLHFSRIGLFCYLLFDKPAILGSNTCIYSEACWNFFPRPSKALLANGVVSVCKLNTGDSGCAPLCSQLGFPVPYAPSLPAWGMKEKHKTDILQLIGMIGPFLR